MSERSEHLKKSFNGIMQKIRHLISEGILWIFGGSIASQVFGFISSVVVIRNLPKSAYGVYVDANNIYSYFAIFIGLGLTTAVMQFGSEDVALERKAAIYQYSFKAGMISNAVFLIIIFGFGYIYKPSGAGRYLRMMCGIPAVVYADNFFQTALIVKKKNREFGLVYITYAITVCLGNIMFTLLWGVTGLVVSTYFSQAVSALVGFLLLKKSCGIQELYAIAPKLPGNDRKEIANYCILCTITNFVSTALVLLDITCLNYVLSDSNVLADYKVASTIPSAMLFVPTSLITYYYPILVEKHSRDLYEFSSQLKECIIIFSTSSVTLFVLLFLFAGPIIRCVYGAKYLNAIPIFRILTINFLVNASIRKLFGNVIAVIKRVKINLLFAAISGVLNVALDVVLIKHMGSEGAAIATVIVTSFISILEVIYIDIYIRKRYAGQVCMNTGKK